MQRIDVFGPHFIKFIPAYDQTMINGDLISTNMRQS